MSIFIDSLYLLTDRGDVNDNLAVGQHPVSDADRSFRAEVAQKLTAAMKEHGLDTQSAAARALGVTRQAFSQYLLRKVTPQSEILARACGLWNIKLRYRDQEFTRGAFGVDHAIGTLPERDTQLDLFDQPQRVENEHLVVILKRAPDSILQVTIQMKKAALPKRARRRSAG